MKNKSTKALLLLLSTAMLLTACGQTNGTDSKSESTSKDVSVE